MHAVLNPTQTNTANFVLCRGGGAGEEGRIWRSFSASHIGFVKLERLGGWYWVEQLLCKDFMEHIRLNNRSYLLLLLVLRSFQVLVQVNHVVGRLVEVWVTPSLNLLLILCL